MANFRKDTQVFGPYNNDRTVFEVPMIANKNGEVVTTENPFPVTITQSIGYSNRSTSNGYRVTAPEGFVAVDRIAGAVKLVDRMEFSRANFTMPKGWN